MTTSWIIREKATRKVLFETYNPAWIKALNTTKYEAVPVKEYLASLNRPNECETCGEDDFSPNIEAFEISGQIVCDECAEEIFEQNGQFGVGA